MFAPSSRTRPSHLLRIELVDAVEDAQQGRLAAAGRTDERGDRFRRHVDVEAFSAWTLP